MNINLKYEFGKNMNRRNFLLASTAAALACSSSSIAKPAEQQPVRLVVAYPVGGVADFAARLVGEVMTRDMNIQNVIENKTGAGGNIALEYVIRQSKEYPTYGVFANSLVTTNPFVPQLRSKNNDPLLDLAPVAIIADMVLLLAVGEHLGVTNLNEFLKKA